MFKHEKFLLFNIAAGLPFGIDWMYQVNQRFKRIIFGLIRLLKNHVTGSFVLDEQARFLCLLRVIKNIQQITGFISPK
jgi:hypothetical protein